MLLLALSQDQISVGPDDMRVINLAVANRGALVDSITFPAAGGGRAGGRRLGRAGAGGPGVQTSDGPGRAYPFAIKATPSFDASLAQTVGGQLVRRPPLPPTLMRLLLLLGLLACAGLAFGSAFLCGPIPAGLSARDATLMRFFPFCQNPPESLLQRTTVPQTATAFAGFEAQTQTAATAAAIAGVTQAAEARPTATPTPSLAPTITPTRTPTPTPTKAVPVAAVNKPLSIGEGASGMMDPAC